ncbi:MAG: A/G-specific adenine glycosylase [Methylophilaceae bacterium]|nr:A/G-specific adenine glycosylase [Methylophilaceae bacterium]
MPDPSFAQRVIAWQRSYGRHDLPWQGTRDPYAIWVSEIMLQQTQVTTVIPYYQRFMARFPDIVSLAGAQEDAVLALWSGLGYYARARNLHAAAQAVVATHGGRFPQTFDAILALPGIGRSTAAAIAVFAFGQRRAILDGNVKRILARCFGVSGWPGLPAVEKQLWSLAESLLPDSGIEAYTQGLMDLGATICTRNRPACEACPLQPICHADRHRLTISLPTPRPDKTLPQKHTMLLLLWHGSEILLEKRPVHGIWGGLWSLPEAERGVDARQFVRRRFGLETELLPALPRFSHTFTHFRLHILPQPLRVSAKATLPPGCGALWLERAEALGAALPAPVRKLLATHDEGVSRSQTPALPGSRT